MAARWLAAAVTDERKGALLAAAVAQDDGRRRPDSRQVEASRWPGSRRGITVGAAQVTLVVQVESQADGDEWASGTGVSHLLGGNGMMDERGCGRGWRRLRRSQALTKGIGFGGGRDGQITGGVKERVVRLLLAKDG